MLVFCLQIVLKFPPNVNRDGKDSVERTTYIVVPEFYLLGWSQIQDTIQNVNTYFMIFKTIQHARS